MKADEARAMQDRKRQRERGNFGRRPVRLAQSPPRYTKNTTKGVKNT